MEVSSLWHHRAFRLYIAGEAASVAGSSLSVVVIPLLAVIEMEASTGQVALLAVVGQLPPLLFALYAGVIAERRPKRRVMICGDLVSAFAVLSLPLGSAFGALTMGQLMVVAAVSSTAGMMHDAAAISIVPALVDRSLIQKGNSRIGALFAIAAVCGTQFGAALAGLVGTARALLVDVLSYLISAWCTARIKKGEVSEVLVPDRRTSRLSEEIREGMRYVFADVNLRTLTLVNATTSLGLGLLNTLWALYLLRELAMPASRFSAVMGLGALGAATGSLLAPAVTRRYGPGPMMLAALMVTPAAQIPLLLARRGFGWQIAVAVAFFVQLCCAGMAGTTQRSIRQCVAAAGMQARMQAVSTWLTAGSRPLAALVAGGIGSRFGVRTALVVGALALVVPCAALYFSPLRTLRSMPAPPAVPRATGEPMNTNTLPAPTDSLDGVVPATPPDNGGTRRGGAVAGGGA
ncbi:MFS transporter [Streptomyces sp. NBC_00190]|uniref:MFS transporter n=1 Tax=unclassified Streptomyces TaxID=2593676 RepID=UPI002E27FB00|nr:MFS transporter [Streptomyces sp. NBC_00190]WSZ38286.1 MFS transporter [Streptomyces sp. NBC_00868]